MLSPEVSAADQKAMRDLHTLLLETEVREGKMVCGNCGHEYKIKEGIANFLLPSHLGESLFKVLGLRRAPFRMSGGKVKWFSVTRANPG